MLKHNGGDRVGKGTYWNLTNGERIDIRDEGILPGDVKKAYYKMPAAAIIVVGPVLGLMYAAFLPFIGIAMAVKLIGQKVGGEMRDLAHGSASFAWVPGASYLTGRNKKETKKEEASKKTEEKKEG